MKNYKLIIAVLASVLGFASCQDVIEVEIPDSERKLVVDAWVRSDTNMNVVKLSRSTNFSDEEFENPETGAQVYISSKGGTRFEFVEDSAGVYIYESNPDFIVDSIYELNIVTKDGANYISTEQKFLSVPKIDSLRFFGPQFLEAFGYPAGFYEEGYYASISAVEKIGEGDFYAWKIFVNGEDRSTGNNLFTGTDEGLIGGLPIPFGFFVFSDSLGINEMGQGDTVVVEQMTINEESFNYISSLLSQLNGGGPFSTPPAPVLGNMSRIEDENETVLGIFILSDSEKKREIVRAELITP